MKYLNKKIKKTKKKMIEYKAKDSLEMDQFERIEKLKRKRDTLLSRGGKIERSHKKRVGNAVNKNIDKRYDVAGKVIERIEGKKKLKEEFKDGVKEKGKYYEIFVNPTQKEIRDLLKENNTLRYILDSTNKKVYLFNSDLLHSPATEHLEIEYLYGTGKYAFGIANGTNTGLPEIDIYDKLMLKEFMLKNNKNIDWVWKYIKKPEWVK